MRQKNGDSFKTCKVGLVESYNLLQLVSLHGSYQSRVVGALTRDGKIGYICKPIGKNATFVSEQNYRLEKLIYRHSGLNWSESKSILEGWPCGNHPVFVQHLGNNRRLIPALPYPTYC